MPFRGKILLWIPSIGIQGLIELDPISCYRGPRYNGTYCSSSSSSNSSNNSSDGDGGGGNCGDGSGGGGGTIRI